MDPPRPANRPPGNASRLQQRYRDLDRAEDQADPGLLSVMLDLMRKKGPLAIILLPGFILAALLTGRSRRALGYSLVLAAVIAGLVLLWFVVVVLGFP